MSEPDSLHRLSVLEERWRSDRSPRVFLQLADELRRLGRVARAVEVLRDGLSWHPESVSGWVVLGRLLLDESDADGAIEALERALERDPAQLVASRLLTEAWIRIGDGGKAEASLERARLLSLPDADYEALAAQVRALALTDAAPALAGRPAPPATSDPFELATPSSLPAIDLARIGPGRRRWARVAIDAAPFAALLAPSPRRRAGGIFELLPRAAAAGAPAGRAPSGEAVAGAVAARADAAPLEVEPALRAESAAAVVESAREWEPPALPPPLEPVFEPLSIGEEVERETSAEALASAALGEAPETVGPPAAPAVVPPAATATLAALYLAQGHLDEAEAEYRRVLGARPDDEEALAGLREVRARRGAPPPLAAPLPAGLTARKLRRLQGLFEGLRARRLQGRVRVS